MYLPCTGKCIKRYFLEREIKIFVSIKKGVPSKKRCFIAFLSTCTVNSAYRYSYRHLYNMTWGWGIITYHIIAVFLTVRWNESHTRSRALPYIIILGVIIIITTGIYRYCITCIYPPHRDAHRLRYAPLRYTVLADTAVARGGGEGAMTSQGTPVWLRIPRSAQWPSIVGAPTTWPYFRAVGPTGTRRSPPGYPLLGRTDRAGLTGLRRETRNTRLGSM